MKNNLFDEHDELRSSPYDYLQKYTKGWLISLKINQTLKNKIKSIKLKKLYVDLERIMSIEENHTYELADKFGGLDLKSHLVFVPNGNK